MGRLTKDPDSKWIKDDCLKLQFYMAVQRPYKKDSGEKEVDFVPVVLFGRQAENAALLLSKGSLVLIWGSLQVRSYDSRDQGRRWVTEVKADNFQLLNRRSVIKTDDNESVKDMVEVKSSVVG